jgi:cation transport ATPase
MSIMVGVGKGAGAGILIKNAEALERFDKVDTLVVDKTGTLTDGRPRLIAVLAANGHDDAQVLSVAASLERSSEHPLAAAIMEAATERGALLRQAVDFQSVTGRGITGGIVRARSLSLATMHNIRQNLVLAFVYNLIGIPIAAGVLYPAFGVLLSPLFAGAAMALSSVAVIGNALRLRAVDLE